ncbi:hypothetical protein HAX54_035908 [Datura stramonium]|uniref:Uncharacterized protein n=1 Tax=Datura stramonium TaxID=4076 RepID=A0ABS8SFT2_DATST|nr:hypothetical protein [Datura stramonium]
MPVECEGCWAHAHANCVHANVGRVRGRLGACPCWPHARDAGRMPMPAECEGRWVHAHVSRVRGPLGACLCRPHARDAGRIAMPAKCKGRWAHAHASRVRVQLGACPCQMRVYLGYVGWVPLAYHVWTPGSAVHHQKLPLTHRYASAQKISNRDKTTLPLTCD